MRSENLIDCMNKNTDFRKSSALDKDFMFFAGIVYNVYYYCFLLAYSCSS